jgi:hypothetical protein
LAVAAPGHLLLQQQTAVILYLAQLPQMAVAGADTTLTTYTLQRLALTAALAVAVILIPQAGLETRLALRHRKAITEAAQTKVHPTLLLAVVVARLLQAGPGLQQPVEQVVTVRHHLSLVRPLLMLAAAVVVRLAYPAQMLPVAQAAVEQGEKLELA